MSSQGLSLRLAGLAPGHSQHHGALEFAVLDAAGEEERYQVEVTCEVDNLGQRVHVHGRVSGNAHSVSVDTTSRPA